MSKLEVNTLAPQTGTTLTIGESGDTVTLGSGATQSGFGGVNTPAFYATINSSQSYSDSTFLTMLYANEVFDTNNAYDTSTGKFTVPSGEAGKYSFYGVVNFNIDSTYTSSGNLSIGELAHYNSSDVEQNRCQVRHNFNYANVPSIGVSAIFDMAVGDYVILRGYVTATTTTYNGSQLAYFNGYKLVE